MIRCPVRLRPRDFEELETYAENNPWADNFAEQIAWNEEVTKFTWWAYFDMLRDTKNS